MFGISEECLSEEFLMFHEALNYELQKTTVAENCITLNAPLSPWMPSIESFSLLHGVSIPRRPSETLPQEMVVQSLLPLTLPRISQSDSRPLEIDLLPSESNVNISVFSDTDN